MKNKDNVDNIIRSSSLSFDELMMQKFAQEAKTEIEEQKIKKITSLLRILNCSPKIYFF
ncbi:MAG: hypothetical protein L6V95_12090 [Candidatus Melainabacteria bacterium]|nr:MAG: hypothetical protein L6V95_12090 [Candidatus Melainabacteria bacterium]